MTAPNTPMQRRINSIPAFKTTIQAEFFRHSVKEAATYHDLSIFYVARLFSQRIR